MKTREFLPENKKQDWTVLQKIAFRFFFIFISLNTWFRYSVIVDIFYPRYLFWVKSLSVLNNPLYWLDKHFYHVGYYPAANPLIVLDDKPIGWVLLITITWFSILVCIVWSVIDNKKRNYNRLNYWFKTYLAYYIFLTMDFYAIFKIAGVQMPFPNAYALLAPFGNKSKFGLLFYTMGISPGYGIFTGLCEFVAAALVLCRRTRVIGCLFMVGIIVNLVCLNIFFNGAVKLLVLQLLLITSYLLVPYILRLTTFFYKHESVSLAEKIYTFSTRWKRYAINALLIIPAWVTFSLIARAVKIERMDKYRRQQRVYDVVNFVKDRDTLPPLLTDTIRIKKIIFTAYYEHKFAVVFGMNDSAEIYDYKWDTAKKAVTLTGTPEGKIQGAFNYKELPGQGLTLDGTWKGKNVIVQLKNVPTDSIPIAKEKTIWVQRN